MRWANWIELAGRHAPLALLALFHDPHLAFKVKTYGSRAGTI
jgi:hypothetical protein